MYSLIHSDVFADASLRVAICRFKPVLSAVSLKLVSTFVSTTMAEIDETTLLQMAKELFPMNELFDVRADGNCFFRGVGKHVNDDQETHESVRATVVARVLAAPSEFEGFEFDLTAWAHTMSKNKQWADGIAVRAAAFVYGPIAVFRQANPDQDPTIFVPNERDVRSRPLMLMDLDERKPGFEHYSQLVTASLAAAPPVPVSWNASQHEPIEDASPPKTDGLVDGSSPSKRPLMEEGGDSKRPCLRRLACFSELEAANSELEAAKRKIAELQGDEPEKKKRRVESSPTSTDSSDNGDSDDNDSNSDDSDDDKPDDSASKELAISKGPIAKPKALPRALAVAKPAAKFQIDDGEGAGVTMGIALECEWTCRRCGSKVTEEHVRKTGKNKTFFVCNVCHSRISQLYRTYGKWPPAHFKTLTVAEQQEFYTSVRNASNAKQLKMITDEKISINKQSAKGAVDSCEYLPISVLKKRGFNVKKIKKRCTDIQLHPILGKCYRIDILSKYEKNEEQHNRKQDTNVSDGLPSSTPLALGLGMNKQSQEEKAAQKESVRALKAEATQKLKESKAKQKDGSAFLKRVAAATSQIHGLLRTKTLNATDKKNGTKIKQRLDQCDKALRRLMVGISM